MTTEIFNYYKYSENLAAGGQPTEEQLEQLKQEQTEVIVNISPVSAKNSLLYEARFVENLKMEYIHYPIDCSNLKPLQYNIFRSIMNELKDKKVFVHCGGNIKTSNLLHIYNVLEMNMDEKQSFETLLQIQKPEEKWFTYFKEMGLNNLN